jgi:hypothetical protein
MGPSIAGCPGEPSAFASIVKRSEEIQAGALSIGGIWTAAVVGF